jgi:hypothetical protein
MSVSTQQALMGRYGQNMFSFSRTLTVAARRDLNSIACYSTEQTELQAYTALRNKETVSYRKRFPYFRITD